MESTITISTGSRRHLTLSVALLGWMFDGFEMGLFPLVARSSLVDLLGSVDDAMVGMWIARITALFLVGAAVGGFFFGWLGDRIGRARALALSILTYSLCTGLCACASTAWHLGLLRFLGALGMGGEWALGVALVMETWPKEQRNFIAGLMGAASHLGFVLVGILGFLLPVTTDSWRSLMLFGVVPGFLTFLIRLWVPESPEWQRCTQTKAPLATLFASSAQRSILLVTIALASIVHIGTWGVVYWAPIWVDKIATGAPTAKAIVQIVCASGAACGGFIGAYCGRYVGSRAAYALSCALSLIFCLALFLWVENFGALFLVVMFCVGFATGTFYGWLAYFLPTLFPTSIRATGQGLAFNAGRIVAIFGVLFTGHMVHALDGAYHYAGALTSLVYVVGIGVVWWLPASTRDHLHR